MKSCSVKQFQFVKRGLDYFFHIIFKSFNTSVIEKVWSFYCISHLYQHLSLKWPFRSYLSSWLLYCTVLLTFCVQVHSWCSLGWNVTLLITLQIKAFFAFYCEPLFTFHINSSLKPNTPEHFYWKKSTIKNCIKSATCSLSALTHHRHIVCRLQNTYRKTKQTISNSTQLTVSNVCSNYIIQKHLWTK